MESGYHNLDTIFCEIEFGDDLDLVKAAVKIMQPDYGFDLETFAEFEPGTGLGGSSAVVVSVNTAAKSSAAPAVPGLVISTIGQLIDDLGPIRVTGSWESDDSRMSSVSAGVKSSAAAIPALKVPLAVLRRSMSRFCAP